MYYLVYDKSDGQQASLLDIEPSSAIPSWYFDEDLREPIPEIAVTLSDLDYAIDLFRGGAYLIASARLIETLHELGESGFEDYPAVVSDRRGRSTTSDFRAFRFRRDVSCLDLSRTECERDPDGSIRLMRRVTLDETRIPRNRHFFQLTERWGHYVASEQFREKWIEAGLRGQAFLVPSELNYWI